MKDDTLKLIGKILKPDTGRDAVHIAVAPMVAAYRLRVGQAVVIREDGTAGAASGSRGVGIVDPFLTQDPDKGETFYVFLYPGTITSLRHEWEHPDFKRKPKVKAEDPKNKSRLWIEAFAQRIGRSYDELMEGAAQQSLYWGEDDYPSFEMAFWDHWEVVTGKTRPPGADDFFRCAC